MKLSSVEEVVMLVYGIPPHRLFWKGQLKLVPTYEKLSSIEEVVMLVSSIPSQRLFWQGATKIGAHL
jgi:hypothetical protein